MQKVYLGDSVYADIEHGMLKLTTENGVPNDPTNVIYLEIEVLAAIQQYIAAWGEECQAAAAVELRLEEEDSGPEVPPPSVA